MARFKVRHYDGIDYDSTDREDVYSKVYEDTYPEWEKRHRFQGKACLGGMQFEIGVAHSRWKAANDIEKPVWAAKIRALTNILEELAYE